MHSLHSITGTSYLTRHKHFIHSIVSSLSLALTRSHKFAATFSTSFFLLLLSLYFECFCISLTSNWNALKLYHHTANFSQVVVLFVSLLSLALIFPAINSHPMLHSLFFRAASPFLIHAFVPVPRSLQCTFRFISLLYTFSTSLYNTYFDFNI